MIQAGKRFFTGITNEVKAMISQNVLPFKLERSNESLTPHAGLVLAHEFHLALGLDRLLDTWLPPPRQRARAPSE